jgi:nitrogen-specific signal transduction histidine kinase
VTLVESKKKRSSKELYQNIIRIFLFTLFLSVPISLIIWYTLWADNENLIHSILELASICIGVATFLTIWSKVEAGNSINNILGFGLLMVALFDFVHVYYYKDLIGNILLYDELSIKCCLVARLCQVLAILVFSLFPYVKNQNKFFMLVITYIISGFILYIIWAYPYLLPDLYNDRGSKPTKILIEYAVVAMAVLVLIRLQKNLKQDTWIRFDFLYLYILLIIPSEICFIIYRDSDSFVVVLGHVLKVAGFSYLYKAVFQSTIKYPYIELNENHQRLSDILNATPLPLCTYNNNNEIDFVNKRFEGLFKYPKDKLLGLNDKEVLSLLRKGKSENEETLPQMAYGNEGDVRNIIRTYLNSDNEKVKVLVNAHKIKGGVLVLMNDVKQEQEIKNLNLQAQTILNAISAPTILCDYKNVITSCNHSFASLIELDVKDIIGTKFDSLKSILKCRCDNELGEYDAIHPDSDVCDCLITTQKGNQKRLQIMTSIISNIYNEKIGTVSVIQDISLLKENQLKLINQEKLALLGQMGATIVHETRNFLTTIKGNSQLIELYAHDEKLKQYARKINASTNEVNRIISDFLNLSKPRDTELEEVAFNDLVLSMKSTIETSSMMNKVKLILDLNYDERYILCDETQVRQVILNICKNAVEAMRETEEPVLQISTGLNECSKEVFIKITDNGEGISSEIIKKIGTPFFTTKKLGTGLGLNACYQIVKEHKGKINIKSELGQGTSFIITIPYIDDDIEDLESI